MLIKLNTPADKVDEIINAMPSLKRPTVSDLYKTGYYAVESVVDKKEVNLLIPKLKNLGAEDILELRINKIVY